MNLRTTGIVLTLVGLVVTLANVNHKMSPVIAFGIALIVIGRILGLAARFQK